MNWEKFRSPARAILKSSKILWEFGKNLKVRPETNVQKILILNLWMNWERLCPNLSFTVVVYIKLGCSHELR